MSAPAAVPGVVRVMRSFCSALIMAFCAPFVDRTSVRF
jgi:hypothetical protein